MRHTINPAFQPVSDGFVNISPLGWYSLSLGNNSLTVSDLFFRDNVMNSPYYGNTITPLHPDADSNKFLRTLRSMLYVNEDMSMGLVNLGLRIKDAGYLTVGINQRIESGATTPRSVFDFMLGGGMTNLDGGINTLNLSGFGAGMTAYMEIGGGYSHKLNDQWTVGGKFKFLLGQA